MRPTVGRPRCRSNEESTAASPAGKGALHRRGRRAAYAQSPLVMTVFARAPSDITDVGRFDDGSDDWLAFRCELGDRPVTVFNFSQTPPLHSSSGPVPFRVAKIQVDGLPRFSLEPRSAATVVETVVGKLLHQPESTIELDPGQHASFGSRYRLRGADRTAVVEFFTPERIRFIEAEQLPGTFASNARYLVYYESTAMRTEADYDARSTRRPRT